MGIFSSLSGLASGKRPLYLHNTLTGKDDLFDLPHGVKKVRMYNCGPTVYGVQHIGNLSMFVFTDILRRTLEYNGFQVKQVINITDVGHLSSDADSGEDKMTLGLRREGLELTIENMRLLANRYTQEFLRDLERLNIPVEKIEFPRASEHIPGEIALIRTLEEKGYTYEGGDGIYFDTSRFPAYGALGNIDLAGLREGARVAAVSDKRHPTDFLLWKKDASLGWESPWGLGFPGWHIECSAMINATLGKQIDIHTGGIEHIPVHHNNEIAQSECATGKHPLSRFWLHRAHVQIDGGKIAKSQGNVVYLSEIIERGFNPLALRYLFLSAHYRTPSNFTWEALEGARTALERLLALRSSLGQDVGSVSTPWKNAFLKHMNDDLDSPGALAVVWNMTKDKGLSGPDLLAGLLDFDQVLGLNLVSYKAEIVPDAVFELVAKREQTRDAKEWDKADRIRDEIHELGYTVEDTQEGPKITPRRRN